MIGRAGEVEGLAAAVLSPDALADWDNDGATNLQEYHNGTNPNVADSELSRTGSPLDIRQIESRNAFG